jgi:TPP-dependent pyruvate/acetoin dehydrogenase alpha subunit
VTKEELVAFEDKIANYFNHGRIRSPVHLSFDNESELIKIFRNISDKDWILCSWRSHYHCLLKGVPMDRLERDILDGKSISLCYPEYNIYSSAIVGGIIPIAVGVSMAIKLSKIRSKVYCFVGDMTAESGIFHENLKYSIGQKLPIKFIVEDNGKSVCTDTMKTWGISNSSYNMYDSDYVYYYQYKLKYPHSGAGFRVQF